jgi:hypothetical protein
MIGIIGGSNNFDGMQLRLCHSVVTSCVRRGSLAAPASLGAYGSFTQRKVSFQCDVNLPDSVLVPVVETIFQ